MKKNISIAMISALAAVTLTGCGGDDAADNSRSANAVPVNVVGVNSVSNTNAPNVDLPDVSGGNSNDMNGGNALSDAKGFMTTAAEDGMFEVEAGKIAASKAQDAAVKQYGQEMASDHTRASNELKQLAQKENVTLPNEPGAAHKQKLEKLKGLSGAEFDREYMTMMVEAHQKAVDLFQNQANTGNKADVKAFASKTLPTLKEHLEDAKSISGKLK